MELVSNMTVKEIGSSLVNEGIGTAGGILGAGFLGAKAEDYFVTPGSITTASSITAKLKGWVCNNLPKAAAWYLMRKYDATAPFGKDLKNGIMGSIVLDSVVRLAGSGVPAPVNINIGGTSIRILGASGGANSGSGQVNQQLAQENSILKAELSKAMRQLSGQPQAPPPFGGQVPVSGAPVVTPYMGAALPATQGAIPQKRQAFYGFMNQGQQQSAQPRTPAEIAREQEYGFMGEQKAGISSAAQMCGML